MMYCCDFPIDFHTNIDALQSKLVRHQDQYCDIRSSGTTDHESQMKTYVFPYCFHVINLR